MPAGPNVRLRVARAATLALTLAVTCLLATVSAAWADVDVSEHTIDEHDPGVDLHVAYPQIGIAADDAALQGWAQAVVDDFKSAAAARGPQEQRYGADLTYTVTRNDARAVVILFTYVSYFGGAHPNTTRTTFNFLLPDGVRVFLPDLIGSDGIQRVSDLAVADLTKQLAPYGDPNWIRTGAGPYAENFEAFEWLPSEVVLHFDPYAVASYADGPKEVHIPLARLQDVRRPDPRAPLPSFDCARAATDVEQAICSDQALAQLDRRVADAYAWRLRLEAQGGQPPVVKDQQVAWLADRDAACGGLSGAALVSCLDDQYAQRLTALRSFS